MEQAKSLYLAVNRLPLLYCNSSSCENGSHQGQGSRNVTSQRIIGFDPGLEVTGYGVIEGSPLRPALVEAGVIRVPTKLPLAERLARLHASAVELVNEHRPQSIAVEELYTHYELPRTAILMGHARGVLLLAAAASGVVVASYLPTRVKKLTTGNGRASKQQMQAAIQQMLGLTAAPEPPDVADALAIALCHYCDLKVEGKV